MKPISPTCSTLVPTFTPCEITAALAVVCCYIQLHKAVLIDTL